MTRIRHAIATGAILMLSVPFAGAGLLSDHDDGDDDSPAGSNIVGSLTCLATGGGASCAEELDLPPNP